MSRSFAHLHVLTHYSLLTGACRIDELVRTAREMGSPAIAITDQGSLFGAVEFFEAAKHAGIRPIFGAELFVLPETVPERGKDEPEFLFRQRLSHPITVLAKNSRGYKSLMKLSSVGYLEGLADRPRVTEAQLAAHADGLIVFSGPRFGEIPQRLLRGDYDGARRIAGRYRDVFGPDFYLELIDHGLPEHRVLRGRVADLGREMDLPLVVTNHVHYLAEHHADAHDALLCIHSGSLQSEENRLRYPTREMYLKTPEQMWDLFSDHEDALENTVRIAEQCAVELELGNLKLPPFPCPPEFATLDSYLDHLCAEGLRQRYGEGASALEERLQYELRTIHQMGYSGYFLIVMDFIRHARSVGVPVGPGRGSAAGSLVSYCLGITNIDPMRYNLLFERFLNPERISMPDIDVDFSDRGRGQVIQYVVEKYGADNVCQIITFGTMAARAAVRDVGRVMGMPYAEVDQLAKMVPAEIGIKLSKALETSPELRARHEADPRVRELVTTAQVLEGLARHASTHAAGVIITPAALTEYVPLHKTSDNEVTTQFDMNACDKIGLLKMDFLGLRTLTVLEDCLRFLKQREIEIDLDTLPLEDSATYELFSRGETVGVFQFESSGMVEYLRKLKPSTIEDLIAMNALYRPGPLGSGMVDDFILRKQGARAIAYEHPILEPILRETYGVIVYQEQVMLIASAMSGYSLGEADILRKAMGKKKKELMKEHRDTFVARAIDRKVPRGVAESTFDLMAHFAGYGFNKSHSAGYALVAYQTGFLKAHYPVEFMAASLSSEMSSSDRIKVLLSEVRRMGIQVLPPDVNRSFDHFTVENGAIRFGLGAVKGVGHGAVELVRQAREHGGSFLDLYDFLERIDGGTVNRKCLEALVQAGALDGFGWTRARHFAALPVTLEWASRRRRERELGQESLFGAATSGAAPRPPAPDQPEWESGEMLLREKASLGLYVTAHPLDEFRPILERLGAHEIGRADASGGDTILDLGGLPALVKISADRKGRPLAFVTLDDGSASLECILFEEPLAAIRSALTEEQPLWLRGRLSARGGETAKLVVTEARVLRPLIESDRVALHLAVDTELPAAALESLQRIVRSHPGSSPLYLHVDHRKLEGVVVRSRSLRVRITVPLLESLDAVLGPRSVRLVQGSLEGTRSKELFGGHRPMAAPRHAEARSEGAPAASGVPA